MSSWRRSGQRRRSSSTESGYAFMVDVVDPTWPGLDVAAARSCVGRYCRHWMQRGLVVRLSNQCYTSAPFVRAS